jgi:hypothetical protein
MENFNHGWYQMEMDNVVAFDEWLHDWLNNADDAIDFGNLNYEELDNSEEMDDSEEMDNSEDMDDSEEWPGSSENPIIIDEPSINADSPLSSIYGHYDDDGNFYANIEEVPSTTAWRPEPSFAIPLMVPPTLDQYRTLQALQQLLDPTEPTFEHGNVHAICGQRRARTERGRKRQYRVIYSHINLDDPNLCLTTSNAPWISYSELIANPDLHKLYERYLDLLPRAPNVIDFTLIVRRYPSYATQFDSASVEYSFQPTWARMLRNRY